MILSLDADFLACGPGALRYARDFAARRRPRETPSRMNRLYVGRVDADAHRRAADHRLPLPAERDRRVIAAARSRRQLGVAAGGRRARGSARAGCQRHMDRRRRQGPAGAPRREPRHRRRRAAAGGPRARPRDQPRARQRRPDRRLHRAGRSRAGQTSSTRSRELVADMNAGTVETLRHPRRQSGLHRAGRPGLRRRAAARCQLRVHLGLYEDETAALCHWHIPEAHFLESWGDARAFDGTASIVQPLIAPLYGGKSAHELLAALAATGPNARAYEHRPRLLAAADPVPAPTISKSRLAAAGCTTASIAGHRVRAEGRHAADRGVAASRPQAARPASRRLEIVFRPDPTICDGRFANNGWLQELPKPITKLTWDNAALRQPGDRGEAAASQSPAIQGGEHGQIIVDSSSCRMAASVAAPRLDHAGPRRRLRHRPPRLRPHARRPRRRPAPASTPTRSAPPTQPLVRRRALEIAQDRRALSRSPAPSTTT